MGISAELLGRTTPGQANPENKKKKKATGGISAELLSESSPKARLVKTEDKAQQAQDLQGKILGAQTQAFKQTPPKKSLMDRLREAKSYASKQAAYAKNNPKQAAKNVAKEAFSVDDLYTTLTNKEARKKKTKLQIAGEVGGSILDVATLGAGGAIAKQVGKQGIKQGAKMVGKKALTKGVLAKEAAIGAGFGTTEALKSGETDVKKIATSAGVGAVAAPALIGGTALAAKGLGKLGEKLKGKKIKVYSAGVDGATDFATKDKSFAKQFNDKPGSKVNKVEIDTSKYLDTRRPEQRKQLESVIGKEKLDRMIQRTNNGLPNHYEKGEQDQLRKAAKELGYDGITLSETTKEGKFEGKDVVSYAKASKPEVKPVDPLFEEAKKYKSAKEFVKAQGNTLYHGTAKGNRFDRFDLKKAGSGVASNAIDQGDQIYLTESENAAKFFSIRANDAKILKSGKLEDMAKTGKDGEVLPFILKPTAKVLTIDDMPRANPSRVKEVISKAKQEGYDVIRFNDKGFDTVEGNPLSASAYSKDGKPPVTNIILNEDSIVSKSQLTDIWNKANSQSKLDDAYANLEKEMKPSTETIKPVGTGEKARSKLAQRVESTLKDTTDDVTYNKMNLAEQADKAVKLVDEDFDKAVRVSKGYEKPPEGMDSASVSIATAARAAEKGDYQLQADIIKDLSLRSTRFGQEISTLQTIGETSPEKFISKLVKEKSDRVKGDTTKAIAQRAKEIKMQTKKATMKINEAQSLIDSLRC